jgi:CRP/FNR family transcriptional regulator, nitrogen fixation regulation protein
MLNMSVALKPHNPLGPVTVRPEQLADHSLAGAFAMLGRAMHFERSAEICGEDEPAEYLYQVVTGAVRTYKVLEDGRRQIGAFHFPGDVFGLESGDRIGFSAEAIADSKVRVAKRSTILMMAGRDSVLAADLWSRMAGGFRSAQEHMLVLGRRNAEERVATFLLDMAQRVSADGVVELPMSRLDIADYLGLTIETVSRTLTQLENKAAIELPSSRRVLLSSRDTLRRLNA